MHVIPTLTLDESPTASDWFCGAGGSSTGLVKAGFKVVHAANHWQQAIETHAANHPDTDHSCADLQRTHPSRFPRTRMAWMSPACTHHSGAAGKRRVNLGQCDLWGDDGIDPAEERSRATMREVIEFTAYHRYEAVIVENVVDIHHWHYFDLWWREMLNLGYQGKCLYLNSRFFDIAQSRDRFYAVFWRNGMRAPNLDFRPAAFCHKCDKPIGAVQVWKSTRRWGKYGKKGQYVYVCPHCAAEVIPPHKPAKDIIDWSLECPAIGKRAKPLAAKTIERVRAGLAKFAAEPFVTSQYGGKRLPAAHIDEPLPTLTTVNNQQQLVIPPFTVSLNHTTDRLRSVDAPLDTVMTQTAPYLTVPPLIVDLKYGGGIIPAKTTDEPLSTIATAQQHALVLTMYNNASYDRVTEPLRTITTNHHHALVIPDELVDACGFRMLQPHELKLAMSFPHDYIILGSKDAQTKQIGNAVCCSVAEWLGRQVMEVLQ